MIYAGHLALKKDQGYVVATMNGFKIFYLFLINFKFDRRYFLWAPLIIILEMMMQRVSVRGLSSMVFGLILNSYF